MCRLGNTHACRFLESSKSNIATVSKASARSVVRVVQLLIIFVLVLQFSTTVISAELTAQNDGYFCRVDDIIARPNGAKSHQFVLINLGIEVLNRKDIDALARLEQRIRAIAQSLIAQRNLKDLSAPNGKRSLRYALQSRINVLLPQGSLEHIYFIDYVVQTRR